MRALSIPEPGEVVKIWMPETENVFYPGSKFRPVLVMAVDERNGRIEVQVAYGTSQHTERWGPGEFVISPSELPQLEKKSKFDLKKMYWLPLAPEYFESKGCQCRIGRLPFKARDRLIFAAQEAGLA